MNLMTEVSLAANRANVSAEHDTLTLSPAGWEVFLKALDDDRPRPRLEAAVERYCGRRRGGPQLVWRSGRSGR